MTDDVSERRERLLEAVRRLKEMNGSPDLLKACMDALEALSGGSQHSDKNF